MGIAHLNVFQMPCPSILVQCHQSQKQSAKLINELSGRSLVIIIAVMLSNSREFHRYLTMTIRNDLTTKEYELYEFMLVGVRTTK
jgi:hypothetical protein